MTEEQAKLTVQCKAKLDVEKVRDRRPSIWLSVFKWLFAILLSFSVLSCVVASKISLISIGIFYNTTRNTCANVVPVGYEHETTFIMMVLVLMVPQFVSFVRSFRAGLFSEFHPWPSKSGIIWVSLRLSFLDRRLMFTYLSQRILFA